MVLGSELYIELLVRGGLPPKGLRSQIALAVKCDLVDHQLLEPPELCGLVQHLWLGEAIHHDPVDQQHQPGGGGNKGTLPSVDERDVWGLQDQWDALPGRHLDHQVPNCSQKDSLLSGVKGSVLEHEEVGTGPSVTAPSGPINSTSLQPGGAASSRAVLSWTHLLFFAAALVRGSPAICTSTGLLGRGGSGSTTDKISYVDCSLSQVMSTVGRTSPCELSSGLRTSNCCMAARMDSSTSGRRREGSTRQAWQSSTPQLSCSIMRRLDSASRCKWKPRSNRAVLPTVLIVV
eukprot:CAMPEP_0117683034 /NCGR_PEP_ID=MMETSP0804-20121206/20095_1 /TAXON_ID=1074897 /ORGANISM="Tetraselmis astigmatica, Strain CCMP880" /LENGTH=289 /DNA_ID=CAMNT_0005493421 /DNA_START=39 /DNA_END=909 /DNA_ORIENTATION=+